MPEQIDWKPYLDKVDAILEGKKQEKLTQNEIQNIINNWERLCRGPLGEFIVQLPPFATQQLKGQLNKELANVVYDILKSSRGENYKWRNLKSGIKMVITKK